MAWSWEGFAAGWNDPTYAGKVREQRMKQEEEAARRQQLADAMAKMSQGGNAYTSALQELALTQSDPRFAQMAIENMRPRTREELLDEQLKEIQLGNANADAELARRREASRARVLGNPQTPNFNPSIPAPALGAMAPAMYDVPPPPAPSAFEQLLGTETTGGDIKPTGPSFIDMVNRLNQATRGAPVAPVETTQLPPPAQAPAQMAAPPTNIQQEPVAQPTRIISIDEWRQSTPEGQAASITGDADKVYAGYEDYVKSYRQLQSDAVKREGEVTKPTEGNLNAANFANRMIAAENMIGGLSDKAGEARTGTVGVVEQTLAALPLGTFGNMLGSGLVKLAATPEQQLYLRNAEDWIRAKLRKESGAVIADEEMAAEYANYFPMPGDAPEAITDKARRRRIAIESMDIAAGPVETPQKLNEARTIQTPAGNVTIRVIGQ